ncbi:MAG: DUF438 domain-containing protein [Clostridiales bacterium]|nr:DUF438 domain-containing protein [Clostridiales bacterium]
MSEFINNREYRQKRLKELIKELHDGASVADVKAAFAELTDGISAVEIAEIEQALVNEGMPVEEIQRLCDVHAEIFKGSIEDIHKCDVCNVPDFEEGHPVDTFKKENRAIEKLLDEIEVYLDAYTSYPESEQLNNLKMRLKKISTIDKHYKRKENLIFPYMEKYNITAPPKVMWGVDDEIRTSIKETLSFLNEEKPNVSIVESKVKEMMTKIRDMIFKEEEIMFPMVLETFSEQEWIEIEKSSAEIGYTLLDAVKRWRQATVVKETIDRENPTEWITSSQPVPENAPDIIINRIQRDSNTVIPFDAGSMTAKEVNAVLNTVPIDMTFVGADSKVKYFTQGKERVFDRPLTIIGREVKNCHPPKSVHIVEKIIEDLKSGKKDNEDFWIKMGPNFVYIRYFAVRSKEGEFLGVLEVTQNIKPIMELEGEKRLIEN